MNLRTLFLSICVLIFFLSIQPVVAQQKIGYIDSERIMQEIPEYSGIKQRLETIAQNWKNEIDEMQAEIDNMKQEYEAREILLTPEVRQQRQREIEQKIREREQYINRRFGTDGDYFRQQEELLEPLQQRILEAVVTVADRENYDHVFDRSGDYLFFYSRQRWDLSMDVLEELGIFVDEDSL